MIRICTDVWRADCIAAIGWDEADTVQVFPIHCSESVDYCFDTKEEGEENYMAILSAWMNALDKVPA